MLVPWHTGDVALGADTWVLTEVASLLLSHGHSSQSHWYLWGLHFSPHSIQLSSSKLKFVPFLIKYCIGLNTVNYLYRPIFFCWHWSVMWLWIMILELSWMRPVLLKRGHRELWSPLQCQTWELRSRPSCASACTQLLSQPAELWATQLCCFAIYSLEFCDRSLHVRRSRWMEIYFF